MSNESKLLIVDDEATILKTLSLKLKSRGYNVLPASSGSDAMAILADHKDIDLVLLDIRMPVMSGTQVLQLIRNMYSALQLPVLMLTGSDEAEAMVEAFQAGANDYLVKPPDIDVLCARIDTQISMKYMNETLAGERDELRRGFVEAKVRNELEKVKIKEEIDKREDMEKSFIQSEKRYRVLYDNTPALCMNLDMRGKILSINRYGALLLGYERDTLVGMEVYDLYHEGDRATAVEYINGIINNSNSLHRWELRKIDSSGNPILLRETAKMVKNAIGEENILMVAVDIADEHLDITLS
jgi:PAS domain S-box-containing protein